jgi:uncharacterized protein (TIGR03437 family)
MNADGLPNSAANPAPQGSTVVLAVVGLGLTEPAAHGLSGDDTPPSRSCPLRSRSAELMLGCLDSWHA